MNVFKSNCFYAILLISHASRKLRNLGLYIERQTAVRVWFFSEKKSTVFDADLSFSLVPAYTLT